MIYLVNILKNHLYYLYLKIMMKITKFIYLLIIKYRNLVTKIMNCKNICINNKIQ